MINVDDRLIREELKAIGVDAFAILMCITTHLGKGSTAWPGIARLREMTSLSKDRAYNAVRVLIESGMVERWQENENGVWGKVVYRVTTQYLNIYVPASSFALSEPLSVKPEYGYPEYAKPESGNPAHISINKKEVINKLEVINKKEERIAPAIFEAETISQKQTPPPSSAQPPSPDLPPEELKIQTAITACLEFFEKWPAMKGVILDGARIKEQDIDFNDELESWVRYHGGGFTFISNITKNIPTSFARWMKNTKQFKPRDNGRQGQGSSNKGKAIEPGVAERVAEQAKRRGITVFT